MTEVSIVHAFSVGGRGGNPAGVVLDADGLGPAQRQALARAVGVPETAFVSRSTIADARLEFYTPTRQIAHCGHATVAAFALMRADGRIDRDVASKESIEDVREIRYDGARVFLGLGAVRFVPDEELAAATSPAALASMLGLADSAVLSRGPVTPVIAGAGNRWLHVPLRDEASLRAIRPDFTRIRAVSDALDLIGLYPYVVAPSVDADALARMFAPRYGIDEEAATGTAAGPLAAVLHERHGVAHDELVIAQGDAMSDPSPSRLVVRASRGDGESLRWSVGGEATLLATRSIAVD